MACLKRDGWKWLITGAAVVGLAAAGNAYISTCAKTEALEYSYALGDRIVEMESLDEVLGQMASGQSDDARRILEARLSSVTALVRKQMEQADASTRAFAVLACFRSAQAEQTRPDLYASSSRSMGSEAQRETDLARTHPAPQSVKNIENN